MQTRLGFTIQPKTGWNVNIPHDVSKLYIFPEPSLVQGITILLQANGQFIVNITLNPQTVDLPGKPLFVAFNKGVTPWLDHSPAREIQETNNNLRSNRRFLIAKDTQVLQQIFNTLYKQGYLAKSCVDNLADTILLTSATLTELCKTWDLLTAAEKLGEGLTPAGSPKFLYANHPGYAAMFNQFIKEAVRCEAKQFFMQRANKEFKNKEAYQYAFDAMLNQEKMSLIIALTNETLVEKIINNYYSLANSNNHSEQDAAHNYLVAAARFPVTIFIKYLNDKPRMEVNAHLTVQNNKCSHCAQGNTLPAQIISSANSWQAKKLMLTHLLESKKLTITEWRNLEKYASQHSNVRTTAIIKYLNPTEQHAIFYFRLAHSETGDDILAYLFKKFDSSRNDFSDSYFADAHQIIHQATLNKQYLLHLLKTDEALLTPMLFYYASKYVTDSSKLDFLLEQHPEAILVTNKNNESLVLNQHTGTPRIPILAILIKNDPRLSLLSGHWHRLIDYLSNNATETDIKTLNYIQYHRMETAKFYTEGTISFTVFHNDKHVIHEITEDFSKTDISEFKRVQ